MIEFLEGRQEINSSNLPLSYGKFLFSRLEKGQGLTLANTLRRILLYEFSSLGVTSVSIHRYFEKNSVMVPIFQNQVIIEGSHPESIKPSTTRYDTDFEGSMLSGNDCSGSQLLSKSYPLYSVPDDPSSEEGLCAGGSNTSNILLKCIKKFIVEKEYSRISSSGTSGAPKWESKSQLPNLQGVGESTANSVSFDTGRTQLPTQAQVSDSPLQGTQHQSPSNTLNSPGFLHEFSFLPGVKENLIQILNNIQSLVWYDATQNSDPVPSSPPTLIRHTGGTAPLEESPGYETIGRNRKIGFTTRQGEARYKVSGTSESQGISTNRKDGRLGLGFDPFEKTENIYVFLPPTLGFTFQSHHFADVGVPFGAGHSLPKAIQSEAKLYQSNSHDSGGTASSLLIDEAGTNVISEKNLQSVSEQNLFRGEGYAQSPPHDQKSYKEETLEINIYASPITKYALKRPEDEVVTPWPSQTFHKDLFIEIAEDFPENIFAAVSASKLTPLAVNGLSPPATNGQRPTQRSIPSAGLANESPIAFGDELQPLGTGGQISSDQRCLIRSIHGTTLYPYFRENPLNQLGYLNQKKVTAADLLIPKTLGLTFPSQPILTCMDPDLHSALEQSLFSGQLVAFGDERPTANTTEPGPHPVELGHIKAETVSSNRESHEEKVRNGVSGDRDSFGNQLTIQSAPTESERYPRGGFMLHLKVERIYSSDIQNSSQNSSNRLNAGAGHRNQDRFILPIDGRAFPIKRVNYTIEQDPKSFKGQGELVFFEIWTNGSITPKEAVSQAIEKSISLFQKYQ